MYIHMYMHIHRYEGCFYAQQSQKMSPRQFSLLLHGGVCSCPVQAHKKHMADSEKEKGNEARLERVTGLGFRV